MNDTAKIIIGLLVVIVIIVIGTSFSNTKDSSKNEGAIKIGVSLPLTGEAASLGEGGLAGAELAAQEINEAGGVNSRMIELVIEDDQCSSDGSNVFSKLVNIDQVDGIIGPLCSAAAGPGVPIAQAGQVPTLIWGSAPALTSTGDYIFRTYPSDAFQGKFGAEYVAENYNKPKVGILYVKNDWGQGLHDVFTEQYKKLGGEIVFAEGISQNQTDVRTSVTKLLAAEPELIYYPMYPAVAISGLKILRSSGVSVPILGADAFESDEVLQVAEADGVIFTVAKFGNPDEFKKKIMDETGKESNIGTPLGYDAIHIFAEVFKRVGTDNKKVRDALEDLEYTRGVGTSTISFDEVGDLKQVDAEVRIIKNKKSESLDN